MALQCPIPVQFSHVFGHGAFAAGAVEPVRDFEASKGDRFVQAKDFPWRRRAQDEPAPSFRDRRDGA